MSAAQAGDWPMYLHDAARTGTSGDADAPSPASVAGLGTVWSDYAGASTVSIAGGTIYAQGPYLSTQRTTDGSLVWNVFSGGAWYAMPTVSDGVVYVGVTLNNQGCAEAFDAVTGALLWMTPIPDANAVPGSPVVSGGLVYMSADSGLVALDTATGTIRWRTRGFSPTTLAARNGVLYGATGSGMAARDAATGVLLWDGSTGYLGWGAFTISGNSAYGAQSDGMNSHVAAFPADGCGALHCSASWVTTLPETSIAEATVVADAHVFVAAGSTFYSLAAATGAVEWTAPLGAWGAAAASVANGVVYVGTHTSKLFAFSVAPCGAATCAPLWQHAFPSPFSVSSDSGFARAPLVVGDTVYAVTGDGTIYALRVGAGTPGPETAIQYGPPRRTSSTVSPWFRSDDPNATFECSVDAGPWAACTSPYQMSPGALGETHSFSVRARSADGTVDPTPATRTWLVAGGPDDTTPPDTTITAGPAATTTETTATFAFGATEPSTFQCKVDDLNWATCTPPQSYTLGPGTHTVTVQAVDRYRNLDPTPATWSWTVTSPGPPDTSITSGPPQTTGDTTATFTFASNVGGATFECRVDGGGWVGCSSPRAYSGFGAGGHTFEVRARNAAGDVDATPAGWAWNVVVSDTTAPDTTILSGPSGSSTATSATFSFSSNESGSTFACALDGSGFTPCLSPVTYSGLGGGSHMFTVRAIDQAGNVDASPASRTWTINVPAAPANDLFANAPTLAGSSGTTAGTTVGATKEAGEPAHAGNSGGHSIWYRFTPTTSGTLVLDTNGSSFDTLLAVYTGAGLSTLRVVASNDDVSSQNTTSRVSLSVKAGTTYRIAVDGWNGAAGSVKLSWRLGR